jgi:hypothetical protein
VDEHIITVAVSDDTGHQIVSRDLCLVKRASQLECEWKVDRINRVIFRDGKAFFPHGTLRQGTENDSAEAAEDYVSTITYLTKRDDDGSVLMTRPVYL